MQVQTAALRRFIQEYFSSEELTHLLFDHFRPVYDNVTSVMPKGQQIQMLLAYCDDNGRFPVLLDALAQKRPDIFRRDDFVASPPVADVAAPVAETDREGTAVSTIIHPRTGKVMLFVPAGDFLYGRQPQSLQLDGFWIDRAPVTNGEYGRFVAATGHPGPRHWAGQTPSSDLADHPVVWVTWHDAQAYATWAGLQLPTEEQWERAARGIDGRAYPCRDVWFANRCNSSETGSRGTSPVGDFSPAGDSPVGCVDMAGNVWEWTASWYNESQARRVARGGAWNSNRRQANATARRQYDPTLAHDHFGFRLAAPAQALG